MILKCQTWGDVYVNPRHIACARVSSQSPLVVEVALSIGGVVLHVEIPPEKDAGGVLRFLEMLEREASRPIDVCVLD